MTYLISYDLNKPGQDYEDLYTTIKGLGSSWCHPADSTWLVVTDKSAVQVRDALQAVVDSTDQLLVVKVGPEGAWRNLSDKVSQWLQDYL